jgi:hypothetical protein
VLGGNVHLDGTNEGINVARRNTATFALTGEDQPTVAKGIRSDSLDTWDKQLDQYHARVASLNNFAGVPYSYGLSDMAYYGAFQDAGGCGNMWRPYFASAGWNPYGSGTWAYYSGAGYSWVSPYPWGWTPYHYGSWSLCPGTGWGWTPGGSWQGLENTITASRAKPLNRPGLPESPRYGGATMIAVNHTALVHSGLDSRDSFVFVKDSAGLGVPRNELGNLRGFSEHAVQKGMASTPIYFSAAPSASNGVRGAMSTPAPVGIQRGYAPSHGGFSRAMPAGSAGGARGVSAPSVSAPISAPTSAPTPGGASGGAHH